MIMQAGKLRHRVTINQKATTRDAAGAEIEAWTTFDVVWGSVEPMRGQEYLEANRIGAAVDTRIRIRYLSGVLPSMQVVFGAHTYNIVSVINVGERNIEMQLMCKEKLA